LLEFDNTASITRLIASQQVVQRGETWSRRSSKLATCRTMRMSACHNRNRHSGRRGPSLATSTWRYLARSRDRPELLVRPQLKSKTLSLVRVFRTTDAGSRDRLQGRLLGRWCGL